MNVVRYCICKIDLNRLSLVIYRRERSMQVQSLPKMSLFSVLPVHDLLATNLVRMRKRYWRILNPVCFQGVRPSPTLICTITFGVPLSSIELMNLMIGCEYQVQLLPEGSESLQFTFLLEIYLVITFEFYTEIADIP